MTVTDIHTGPPCRFVITGGPSAGKEAIIEAILKAGMPCSKDKAARAIYRAHRARLGRHLEREDRRDYSREVLQAFVTEYCAHTEGVRSYDRGIPDGYGWDRFFGLEPYPDLEEATTRYRYELIMQGYYDAGYAPVFIPADKPDARLDFICANLRLPPPRPAREE